MKLTQEEKDLLNVLYGEGPSFVQPDKSANLFSLGLVELNHSAKTADGIATRISPKGEAFLTGSKALKLAYGLPIPPLPKRAGRPALYPFAEMSVNSSFLVKACEKMPTPYESLKASVSIANKKFTPKRFEIRRESEGVRIFRTV